MKILITGSRSISDYKFVEHWLVEILGKVQYDYALDKSEFEMISGHNPSGADYLCEKWAKENNIKLKLFPADWNEIDPQKASGSVMVKQGFYGAYNALAGFNRNQQMIDYCMEYHPNVICIAFDAGTPGTKDTIARAKKNGIETHQIRCKDIGKAKLKIWNKDKQR